MSACDKLLSRLEYALNLAGGLLVFALMILGVVQIILRTVFRNPIFGYIDIVEVTMIGFAILGIAYVQNLGGHVRMELIIGRLSGRALWVVEFFGTALAFFFVSLLIPYSFNHFMRAWTFGDSTIDIELVTWPAKLVVPLALGVLALRLILQMAGYARLIYDPAAQPIAVPLIKDTDHLAADEIAGSSDGRT